MHIHELRIEQRDLTDYMKGPEKLAEELKTASRETKVRESGAYGHREFNPQEVSRYDYLSHLLSEFEDCAEYAFERSARKCIEYVAREVLLNVLETVNKNHGSARNVSNTNHVLRLAYQMLFEGCHAEEQASDVLNRVVEENDVRNIDENTVLDVMKKMREIFEIDLTDKY